MDSKHDPRLIAVGKIGKEIARHARIVAILWNHRPDVLGTRCPAHSPHFHAYYQDDAVSMTIDTIEILAGRLPRKQQRLVEAWAELHQTELLAAWQAMLASQPPGKIEPL